MRSYWLAELVLVVLAALWIRRVVSHSPHSYSDLLKRFGAAVLQPVREGGPQRWAFLALVVVALAVRLYHMDQPIRYDEAWTYLLYASRPLWTAASDYTAPNNHIFHSLLAWVATRLFGAAPWTLRLPALLAGLALVPAVYLLARRLSGRDAGIVAMALAASSPILVLYSTNARGYALISLAFVMLLLLADALLERPRPELWIVFGVVTALGAYTAPVMLYPAGAAALWLVVETVRTRGVRGVTGLLPGAVGAALVAIVIVLAAYAPVVGTQGAGVILGNRFVVPLTWPQFVAFMPEFARTLRESLALGRSLPVLALLGLAAAASFVTGDARRVRRLTLALAVAVWCAVLLAATRRPPPARVWLFLVPLGYVYVGAGAAPLLAALAGRLRWRRELLPAAAGLLLAVATSAQIAARRVVVDSDETDWLGLRNGPAVAAYLQGELRPGDEVVTSGTAAAIDYYLQVRAGRALREFRHDSGAVRAVVVVNEAHGQTPTTVLQRRRNLRVSEGVTPRLLHRVGSTVVYDLPARVVPSPATAPPAPPGALSTR